jgi:hypothetical protein
LEEFPIAPEKRQLTSINENDEITSRRESTLTEEHRLVHLAREQSQPHVIVPEAYEVEQQG